MYLRRLEKETLNNSEGFMCKEDFQYAHDDNGESFKLMLLTLCNAGCHDVIAGILRDI